ncbi:unnamed protein product [Paramecium octaurelia]|uniref:Uncharacterized protein n=1 Tax=Paramecium octaurelia TaxID=43137 RepID=A0A8S1U4F1_PAROT|nr:unnamed protein product [Paramecium octaurelia]
MAFYLLNQQKISIYTLQNVFSLGYDFRRPFWNLIIKNIQLARKKCKLEIRNFDDDISLSDCNLELLKFIQYFIDTLLRANQEELVVMMQQLLPQQQQEIMGLVQNQINDIGTFQDCGYFEHQTTNTIISLEENLNTKENIIAQQNKQFELMKTEYQSKISDQQNKITQLNELYEQLYDSELFCLQKLNCCDFEEVFNKFEEFLKEIEDSKQIIEDLNQLVQNQQKEIAKVQQKNQTLKSQLLSCPPTARSIEPEQQQIIVKDPKEQMTIEKLNSKIQKMKEEHKDKLEYKQVLYQSELKQLENKLKESEKEAASFKKKMEKFKFELEEYQNMNQYERKLPFESLRHQGVYSSNNSYIVEIDQRFGQSPKSTCFDFFQSQNKSEIDHAISHNNQSLKYTDETNVTKLQLQLTEKSKQITLLEKQLSCYQQSSHSRRNSMAKQFERHQDQQVIQEQLKYYQQQSEQRDREINEMREQQNQNFIDLCKQTIKQNEQIQKLNSIILNNKSSDQMQEITEKHQNDLQALNQYYVDALNNKDEQLHLIISLFYDAIN